MEYTDLDGRGGAFGTDFVSDILSAIKTCRFYFCDILYSPIFIILSHVQFSNKLRRELVTPPTAKR